MSSSEGDVVGVGEATSEKLQDGILCGSGDISMCSRRGAGEEEGRGGVVTNSRAHVNTQRYTRQVVCDSPLLSKPPTTVAVNNARRGVGK